jgi:hypothetical protein
MMKILVALACVNLPLVWGLLAPKVLRRLRGERRDG